MIGKYKLSGEFLKYTAVLMSGTMVAQVLGYLLAPVITRLYTPEEAAPLGLFLRIVAVGSALATARYELSLPLAQTDNHSFRLYQVAVKNSILVTLFSGLLILIPLIYPDGAYSFTYYLLIPPAILLTAAFNLGNNWSLRLKSFRNISFVKVSNAGISNLSKVIFGWMGIGYMGLVYGTVAGLLVGNFWFFKEYVQAFKAHKVPFSSPRNRVLAKEFIDFPKINLPHVMSDLIRDLVVAFAILQLFSQTDFGLYDHAYRMLRLPLILVGIAIGQVLYQRCSEMFNRGEPIADLVRNSIVNLSLISIIPFLLIMFFGKEIFGFVFGANWAGSGEFAQIMAPWLMVNFITSPVSSVPLVIRKQREFFLLALAGTLLMILTVVVPPLWLQCGIQQTLWFVTVGQILYLIVFIMLIRYYLRQSGK